MRAQFTVGRVRRPETQRGLSRLCSTRKFVSPKNSKERPFSMNKLFHSRTAQPNGANAFRFSIPPFFCKPKWTSFFCLFCGKMAGDNTAIYSETLSLSPSHHIFSNLSLSRALFPRSSQQLKCRHIPYFTNMAHGCTAGYETASPLSQVRCYSS